MRRQGIRAVAYDLAVKILSDTPAGGVLYGQRMDETFLAESCVPLLLVGVNRIYANFGSRDSDLRNLSAATPASAQSLLRERV